MSDYRFVGEEEADVAKIIQEKNLLAYKIDKRTIKDDNQGKHYDKIKNKCSDYYETFQEIYHQKCGYCGVSVSINSAPQYELDHFINEFIFSYYIILKQCKVTIVIRLINYTDYR